jgi:hypothetical protein
MGMKHRNSNFCDYARRPRQAHFFRVEMAEARFDCARNCRVRTHGDLRPLKNCQVFEVSFKRSLFVVDELAGDDTAGPDADVADVEFAGATFPLVAFASVATSAVLLKGGWVRPPLGELG